MWLSRVARLNPATSAVILAWDCDGIADFELRSALLAACLDDLPPRAISDIMAEGILAIGGGSILRGMSQMIEESFGLPVKTAERPLTCVAEGATACMDHPEVVAAFAS